MEQVYRVVIMVLLFMLVLAPLSHQETGTSEWIASIESNRTVVLIDASILDGKLLVQGIDSIDRSILLVVVDLEKLVLTPIKLYSDRELVLHSYLKHNNELLIFYEAEERGPKYNYIQAVDLLSLNSSTYSLKDIEIRDSTEIEGLIVIAGETHYTEYIPTRPGSPPIAKEEERITLIAIDSNFSKAYGYWVKCGGKFVGGNIVGAEKVDDKVALLVSRVENKDSIILVVDIHHGEAVIGFLVPYTTVVLSTYGKYLGLATRDNSVIYGYINNSSFSYSLFELEANLVVDGLWMLQNRSIIIEYINTTYYVKTPHRYVFIIPTNGKASMYLVETSYPRIQVDVLVVYDDYMYLKLEDIVEKKNFIARIKLGEEKEYIIPSTELRIKKTNNTNTLVILDNITTHSIQPIKCRLERYPLELVYIERVASIEKTSIKYNFSKLKVVRDGMEEENMTTIEEVVANATRIRYQTTTATKIKESLITNETTSTTPTITTTSEPSSDIAKHGSSTEEWGHGPSIERRDIYEAILVFLYVISSIVIYFLVVKK